LRGQIIEVESSSTVRFQIAVIVNVADDEFSDAGAVHSSNPFRHLVHQNSASDVSTVSESNMNAAFPRPRGWRMGMFVCEKWSRHS